MRADSRQPRAHPWLVVVIAAMCACEESNQASQKEPEQGVATPSSKAKPVEQTTPEKASYCGAATRDECLLRESGGADTATCGPARLDECASRIRSGDYKKASTTRLVEPFREACDPKSKVPCAGRDSACSRAKGRICTKLARIEEHNERLAEAASAFTLACRVFEYEDACSGYRRLAAHAKGAKLDKALASDAVSNQAGCDGKDWGKCWRLGKALATGEGVKKDVDAANRLFEQACDHEPGACYSLAESYLLGRGFTKDPKKGRALLEKACTPQYGKACTTLAIMVRHGKGGPKSLEKALEWYQKGCKWKDFLACANVEQVKDELAAEKKAK